MYTENFELPSYPETFRRLEEKLIETGLTQRVTIEGNHLHAVGEAGLGIFHIIKKESDRETMVLEITGRNREAVEIVSNIAVTYFEDIREDVEKIREKANDIIVKEELKCGSCGGEMTFLTEHRLTPEIYVYLMECTDCHKIEMYRFRD